MSAADLMVHGGPVVTMNPVRQVWADGGVVVQDGAIVDIGPSDLLRARWQPNQLVDVRGQVIAPGLVNAHVHLTGLDLLPGLEPTDSPRATHLQKWALPSHVHSTPADERVCTRYIALSMLKQGITAFIDAGTNRFPEAVLDGLVDMHLRGAIGTWTWDRWDDPPEFATETEQAIGRMCAALDLAPAGARVRVWPTLVGHTSCSDALWQTAAAEARRRDTNWSFHMSPGTNDGDYYRAHTGRDPLVHLDQLGVLDDRAVVTHALYVSDAEIETLNRSGATVAFCPAGNLHLGSGLSQAGRHLEMQHVALGTDSPHNLPLLHAAGLATTLYGDMRRDRSVLPAERALEWVTLAGARALGAVDQIGSLEIGKRADIAVFEVVQPIYNIANALVHHPTSGRATHVFVDGKQVVCDGHVAGEEAIVSEATTAGREVALRAGLPAWTGWPLSL
jgi:cytosine/adenosine deaminase-related metal-dependent hydrolase